MAYENDPIGGASGTSREGMTGGAGNGQRLGETLQGTSAGIGNARTRAEQAQEWARTRGNQATQWARSQLTDVQGRIATDPQRATLWALAVGAVFGLIVSSVFRSGSRR